MDAVCRDARPCVSTIGIAYGKHADKNSFLQYQAVMDGNIRAEHAALHGVIKCYDDEFLDEYYPPNGWGCRCEAIIDESGMGNKAQFEQIK